MMETQTQTMISPCLTESIDMVLRILPNNADLQQRMFHVNDSLCLAGAVFYIDGLTDTTLLDSSVLYPLLLEHTKTISSVYLPPLFRRSDVAERIGEAVFINHEIKMAEDYLKGIEGLLAGNSLLFLDGFRCGFLIGTKGWESRPTGETATELVVRGPRDGFTENLRTNTSLVRRRIKDTAFRLEAMTIGTRSKTAVNIAYLEGVAKPELVEEVKRRLESIQIDAILESGYIEELIEDVPYSPFPTVRYTERPDSAASVILEGRVLIFVDTTPFALIAPTYFWDALIAPDDYYSRFYFGSFARIIRVIALIISFTLPSIYVMLVSYHQEMIPTELALTIAAGRESVPFPVLVEVFIMEVAFELMREAGVRMPRPVGQAVSIVGSLVIGQAAVQAGLVSPIMVIIVALTGIASFAIPNYSSSFAIRLLRFPLLIGAGTLGLLGFAAVIYIYAIHLLSMRSFGEPYLAPIIPFRPSDQKDSLVRLPWWQMKKRPATGMGSERLGTDQRPKPPVNNESEGAIDEHADSTTLARPRRRQRKRHKVMRET